MINYKLQLEEKLQEQKKIKREIKLLKKLISLNKTKTCIEIPIVDTILEYTHKDIQNMSKNDLIQIFRENVTTIEYVKQNSDFRVFDNASMNNFYMDKLVDTSSLHTKSKNNENNNNVVFIIEQVQSHNFNLKKLFIDKIKSISIH